MGQRFYQIIGLLSAVLLSSSAFAAYKIGIYTDQPSQEKSKGLIEYLKTHPPFNRYEVEFEIKPMSTQELNCGPAHGIARLITCDTAHITSVAHKSGIDQAFVVSNYPVYGGSGGTVPVMTTDSGIPYSTMVHEYLHTIGFGDEYAYRESETPLYCTKQNMARYINLAVIEPLGSYSGDYDARNKHAKQIPWYGKIESSTPIATTILGTPNQGQEVIGLFKARTCQNSPTRITVWRPGESINVMEKLSAGMNELEPLVHEAMDSKGLRRKDGTTDIQLGQQDEPCDQTTPTKPTFGGFFEQLGNFLKSLFGKLFG